MKEYIDFKKVNCKDCYKCLRNCPVKSMRFSNHQAEIIEDECILCGSCYLTCPQGAKEIRNDVVTIKSLLKSQDVYVTLAPSFIANYPSINFATMKKALLKLGFKDVEETAIGAELVTREYEKIIENKQDIIISTCCQSVNLLIKKYYPEAVKYLAKVVSPMTAHARMIKKLHKNCSVVFIGPCLSKKEEVDENLDSIDCAITFLELTKWLKEENINFEYVEEENDKYLTRLYPTSSGILKTMKKDKDYSYVAIDGITNCREALEEILSGKLSKCFIEMSSCVGSCINGPGMDKKVEREKSTPLSNYINVINYSGDKKYNPICIETDRQFISQAVKEEKVNDEIIKMLLAKIGKTKPSDELNCGSCGYNTCKEKAYAMYYGKTEPSMCLPYLKNKAESFVNDIVENTPNGIIIVNDKLEIELANKSACEIIKVLSPKDVVGQPIIRILDPTPYLKVLNTKMNNPKEVIYLSEYQKYVEQTIIYDSKYEVIMIIIRDVTEDIKQKASKEAITRETIEVTDKVIEKQMRAVQEIASLLGETTAETKVALEKLKQSLNDK